MNLAQRLVKTGVLEQEQLAPALFRQKRSRGYLAQHLLDLDLVEPEVLAQFVYDHPPIPETFEDLGLPKSLLIQLLLKHSFFRDAISSQELAHEIKISRRLVDKLLAYLQGQGYMQVKARDALSQLSHLSINLSYSLTDAGKIFAEQCLESNRYVGPAPVPLEDYWDWVEAQAIHQIKVEKARLTEVFADYVVPDDLITKLGPAINSARSIFLFGPSGNGKTMIANCLGHAYQDAVYVPYALFVYGQIIRLYDELNHQPIPPTPETQDHDRRWVLCQRPIVIAGGEMTEDALELRFNPHLKYYEAPHQMRANNGVFIIDDFGRQKITPRELLNRWIYPLETRQDFCCLHTGQQFAVPFDQLIIFSTNLNPYSLADEAFLRRIRHKIFIGYVSPDHYLEIFRRVCAGHQIDFDEAAVRDIMARYYVTSSRPFCASHPRDLIENLIDRARFLDQPPQLTSQELDFVCQTYFIKPLGVTDYDAVGDQAKAMV
jgi:biotin operon repressor